MILVFGTICIDRPRRIKQYPRRGGYAEILNAQEVLGGEAANTANALMKWGASFRLAGNPIGESGDGKRLGELVRETGLPVKDLQVRDSITPICDIYVSDDGERTMFGVGFQTISDYLSPATAPYEPGGWFTLDSNLGDSGQQALQLAKDAGMNLFVMDILEPKVQLEAHDYWQCSTDWVGKRGDIEGNCLWLANWVAQHRCTAVLTDGSLGLIIGSTTIQPTYLPQFPCPAAVDSTGAGDTFRAGMLYGLDQGWELSECLKFASAAGCLSCMGFGAMGHVPTDQEVQKHIIENPNVAAHYDRIGS